MTKLNFPGLTIKQLEARLYYINNRTKRLKDQVEYSKTHKTAIKTRRKKRYEANKVTTLAAAKLKRVRARQ